ncbi:hypothetical protein CCP1ISM_7190001 [Azospirillaceae bacterium]
MTDFVDQVRAHHEREEGLMMRYEYTMVRDHSKEHLKLLRELETIQVQLRNRNIDFTQQAVDRIKDQLTGHINNSDANLEIYLAQFKDKRTKRRKDLSQPSRNPLFYVRAITNGVPAGVVMANRAKRASLDAAKKQRAMEQRMALSISRDNAREEQDALWYR